MPAKADSLIIPLVEIPPSAVMTREKGTWPVACRACAGSRHTGLTMLHVEIPAFAGMTREGVCVPKQLCPSLSAGMTREGG